MDNTSELLNKKHWQTPLQISFSAPLLGLLACCVVGCSVGCAQFNSSQGHEVGPQPTAKQTVQQMAQSESGTTDIAQKGFHAFFSSPELTEKERKALLDIHTETLQESAGIRADIGRYKSVLFRLLVTGKPQEKEIEEVKKKITDLYLQRLTIMMKALDKAKFVLGKDPKRLEKVFKPMLLHSEDVLLRSQ